ncbi:MAG: chemotaxis protein CheX [Planctomycetota bacterium]
MKTEQTQSAIASSVINTIETMLRVEIRVESSASFSGKVAGQRIIAAVGLGGPEFSSMLYFFFTPPAARKLVGLMLDATQLSEQSMLRNGVGELTNMVAGGIKQCCMEEELEINLSLPTVLSTESLDLHLDASTEVLPFRFVVDGEQIEGVFLMRKTLAPRKASPRKPRGR